MKLLTQAILKAVPALYAQDGKGRNAIAYAKFFCGAMTWYMTEYDPVEKRAFGLVYSPDTPDGELGYFSLAEIERVNARAGYMKIERELDWSFRPLTECDNPCRPTPAGKA